MNKAVEYVKFAWHYVLYPGTKIKEKNEGQMMLNLWSIFGANEKGIPRRMRISLRFNKIFKN